MALKVHQTPVKLSNLHWKLKKKTGPKTKEAALALLEMTRRQLILRARHIARQLTPYGEEVDTRMVRQAMIDQGLYKEEITDHWMGAVFRGRDWIWTGKFRELEDMPPLRDNTHAGRTIKIWRRARR